MILKAAKHWNISTSTCCLLGLESCIVMNGWVIKYLLQTISLNKYVSGEVLCMFYCCCYITSNYIIYVVNYKTTASLITTIAKLSSKNYILCSWILTHMAWFIIIQMDWKFLTVLFKCIAHKNLLCVIE